MSFLPVVYRDGELGHQSNMVLCTNEIVQIFDGSKTKPSFPVKYQQCNRKSLSVRSTETCSWVTTQILHTCVSYSESGVSSDSSLERPKSDTLHDIFSPTRMLRAAKS